MDPEEIRKILDLIGGLIEKLPENVRTAVVLDNFNGGIPRTDTVVIVLSKSNDALSEVQQRLVEREKLEVIETSLPANTVH
jgi:hypothetical protein